MEMYHSDLTEKIIGAAIEVHNLMGPGLLESAYEKCLCRELELLELPYESQLILPVTYKGVEIESGYRIDILVDQKIVLELKTVEELIDVHEAQLLTHLKFSRAKVGLLINFRSKLLKDGIRRFVM